MRLWIRADASPQIGLGHVMRSIAVAERARQARIPAMFVLGGGSRSAPHEVRTRGFEVRFGAERERWVQDIGSSVTQTQMLSLPNQADVAEAARPLDQFAGRRRDGAALCGWSGFVGKKENV